MLEKRRKRGEEPVEPEELSDEAALLVEIRDLLAVQATGVVVPPGGGGAFGARAGPAGAAPDRSAAVDPGVVTPPVSRSSAR